MDIVIIFVCEVIGMNVVVLLTMLSVSCTGTSGVICPKRHVHLILITLPNELSGAMDSAINIM